MCEADSDHAYFFCPAQLRRTVIGEDRSVLYDVSEVSRERRNGYSWYGNGPARYLEQYRQWSAARSSTPARK